MKRKTRLILTFLLSLLLLISCSREDVEPVGSFPYTAGEQNKENEVISASVDVLKSDPSHNTATDNTIVWAFPNHSFDGLVTELNINKQLESDGYPFRIKCVFPGELGDFGAMASECEADVVYGGMGCVSQTSALPPVYDGIMKGRYLCLDDYLKGSKLLDSIPESLWNSVKVDGKICCIPNVNHPDSCFTVVIKKSDYSPETIASFDGTPEQLFKLLSKEKRMVYAINDFCFLSMYGIQDTGYGVCYENGVLKNCVELPAADEWYHTINSLHSEGKVIEGTTDALMNTDGWSVGLCRNGNASLFSDEEYAKFIYPAYIGNGFSSAIGIRSDTDKAKMAFDMIQLFFTDPKYGNLIIYGNDVVENNGYAVDVSGNLVFSYLKKLYWGIGDGTLRGGDEYYYFANSEERKEFYQKYISEVSMDYMNYPEQIKKILDACDRYRECLLKDKDKFEKDWKTWKEKTSEYFAEIK